jgi:hypothetical protein
MSPNLSLPPKTAAPAKTAKPAASVKPAAPVKPVKAAKVEISPEVLSNLKLQLREQLKNVEDEKLLNKIAKNFNVDVKPYAQMGAGLRRMNIVNSICGSAARGLRGGYSEKEIYALLKV